MTEYVYHTEPYAHQRAAFDVSRDRPFFALLMEQGTGKSKVIIDTAAWLYERGEIDSLLVIAPNGVHVNWTQREIPQHLPPRVPRKTLALSSAGGKRWQAARAKLDVADSLKCYAMNVEMLSLARGRDEARRWLQRHPRTMLVVDESTTIKAPRAKRTKSVLALRAFAPYRRILTGIPVTQSPLDVWAQFCFLSPTILGSDYYPFKCRYARLKVRHTTLHGRDHKFEEVVGYRNLDELRLRLAAHSYRVTKAECLDLPEKVYTQMYVELTPEQRRLYSRLQDDLLFEVDGRELSVPMLLTRLTRLQQLTSGIVAGYPGTAPRLLEPNPKLHALLTDLEDLPATDAAIIWARFVPELEAVAAALRQRYGADAVGLYRGATGRAERQEIIDRFQGGACRILVANAATAGLGLTLHRAATVYYLSNSYSYGERVQSEDRSHRIGQDRTVVYKDILCAGTIDERVREVLAEKRDLADVVTGDGIRKILTSQDVEDVV